MRKPHRSILAPLVLLLSVFPAVAQLGFSSGSSVLPMDEAFEMTAERQEDGALALNFEIEDGYYLYRKYLAATTVDGRELAVESPAGTVKDDPNFGRTEIYYDTFQATVDPGDAGTVRMTYQGCQDGGLCYPPTTKSIDVASLAVSDTGSSFASGGAAPAGTTAQAGGAAGSGDDAAFAVAMQDGGMVSAIRERGGVALVLASFFGFGVLLAFTPCVFPMYPILAATLAREGETLSMRRGFTLSLAYVLALASAFGLLGVAAAWSGQNLQMVLQSPLAIGMVSVVFVLLAASMFGLFELTIPAALTNRLTTAKLGSRGSHGQAAALGFTSALIVGPCVTAPLAGALLYIAQTTDVALGAAALFALGLGKGIPLIVMGTFGMSALPRAGAWMERAKHFFGFIFLSTAVYLVGRIVPETVGMALWAVLLIAGGVFLGASDALTRESRTLDRAGKAFGIVVTLYGVVLGVGAAAGGIDPMRPLAQFANRGSGGTDTATESLSFASASDLPAMEAALASGGEAPSLVYFTADWCITCKVIERNVLPDEGVIAVLDDVKLIKADITRIDDDGQALMEAMGVVGPPTMIFFDASENEVGNTRLVGDVTVDTLTRSAAAVKESF